MNAKANQHPIRTTILRMLAGAVVGGAAAALTLNLMGDRDPVAGDVSALIALVAGLTYVLMGLFVGAGATAPRAGALFLNVEDAEELREQRPQLGTSAVGCMLIGVFLLALMMSGEDGFASREVGLLIAAAAFGGSVILSVRSYKQYDELTRQISLEASTLTLHLAMIFIGGWAALSHLGYVDWVTPLAFISLLALLQLIAIFIVAGRRGLLSVR